MSALRRNTVLRGGIDLGGTKIQTVVVDPNHEVLGEKRGETPLKGEPTDVADAMVATMREAARLAGVETSSLSGVGVGSPGAVAEDGSVSEARNLPGWDGTFPLGDALSQELGVPVRVGNDVQVATDAEFATGVGKPFDSLLGVFWGTGVGGGLVLGGRPWLGRGAAGEIGHMVVKEGGAKCPCGRHGCMEAYAGRIAMEAEARHRHKKGEKTVLFKLQEKKDKPRLTSGIWEDALNEGDKLAKHLFDRAIEALGTGVASAVNLIDPEAVVIGGGMGVRFGQPCADRILDEMKPHLFVDENPPVVEVAALGDLGGAIGAAMLVG
jgi:glucokinase